MAILNFIMQVKMKQNKKIKNDRYSLGDLSIDLLKPDVRERIILKARYASFSRY